MGTRPSLCTLQSLPLVLLPVKLAHESGTMADPANVHPKLGGLDLAEIHLL